MLDDLVEPGVRVVIAGTIARWHRVEREHYYHGAGNHFWTLLHESGLVPRRLNPAEDHLLPGLGVGLTDLVRVRRSEPGEPPVFDVPGFHRVVRRADPLAVAFVSKTAARSYARAAGVRAPQGYGALSWQVTGRPAFVLPGPSGANNGMPLPLRIALWRDLVDFLDTL